MADDRSTVLPADFFDQSLARLIGLPNGAHTQPTVVQAVDFYGNTTSYMVQTVKTDEGPSIFVTIVNAANSARFILPPAVIRVIDRQRHSTTKTIRRRHGQRVAAARGNVNPFTPEMREKARQTRQRNAAKRRKPKE